MATDAIFVMATAATNVRLTYSLVHQQLAYSVNYHIILEQPGASLTVAGGQGAQATSTV